MIEKILPEALTTLRDSLKNHDFLFFTIVITIAISFRLQNIYNFFQSISKQKLQSLEEYINNKYLTPETRYALQEQINSIIFKSTTGIRAEKHKREQIVALHKYAKGTLKFRDFQQARIFLKINCNGNLKIRKIMFFEHFMYYWYFVAGIFLNFLSVVCFSLFIFAPLTDELQKLFILLTGFFFYFGCLILSQTWPISAAKDIQKVITNYRQETGNQSLLPSPNQNNEVFDQTNIDSFSVNKQTNPSHVILPVEAYQHLLESLEDEALYQAMKTTINEIPMSREEALKAIEEE